MTNIRLFNKKDEFENQKKNFDNFIEKLQKKKSDKLVFFKENIKDFIEISRYFDIDKRLEILYYFLVTLEEKVFFVKEKEDSIFPIFSMLSNPITDCKDKFIEIVKKEIIDILKKNKDNLSLLQMQEIIKIMFALSIEPSHLCSMIMDIEKKKLFSKEFKLLIIDFCILFLKDGVKLLNQEFNKKLNQEFSEKFGENLLELFYDADFIAIDIKELIFFLLESTDFPQEFFIKVLEEFSEDKYFYYTKLIEYYKKHDMQQDLFNTLIKALNDKNIEEDQKIEFYIELINYFDKTNNYLSLVKTIGELYDFSISKGRKGDFFLIDETVYNQIKEFNKLFIKSIEFFYEKNDYESLKEAIRSQIKADYIEDAYYNIKKYIKEEEQKEFLNLIFEHNKIFSKIYKNEISLRDINIYDLEKDYKALMKFIKNNSKKIRKTIAYFYIFDILKNKEEFLEAYPIELLDFLKEGVEETCFSLKMNKENVSKIISMIDHIKYIYYEILNDKEAFKEYLNIVKEKNFNRKILTKSLNDIKL